MKRLRLILILLAVIFLGCLALLFVGPKEPSYHGKTLTEWLDCSRGAWITVGIDEWADLDPNTPVFPNVDDSIDAIRKIGTNGLPFLLKLIQATDSPLKTRLIRIANDQKVMPTHFRTEDEKVKSAFFAFHILGNDALPVIPNLVQLTKSSEVGIRQVALLCLDTLHPQKHIFLPVLKDALQDSDPVVRNIATLTIRSRFPEDAGRLGPALGNSSPTKRPGNQRICRRLNETPAPLLNSKTIKRELFVFLYRLAVLVGMNVLAYIGGYHNWANCLGLVLGYKLVSVVVVILTFAQAARKLIARDAAAATVSGLLVPVSILVCVWNWEVSNLFFTGFTAGMRKTMDAHKLQAWAVRIAPNNDSTHTNRPVITDEMLAEVLPPALRKGMKHALVSFENNDPAGCPFIQLTWTDPARLARWGLLIGDTNFLRGSAGGPSELIPGVYTFQGPGR